MGLNIAPLAGEKNPYYLMSNPFKQCPFHLLGISARATTEDVLKKWKKLMLENHPDKNSSEHATDKSKVLNDAKDRALKVCLSRELSEPETETSEDDIDPATFEKWRKFWDEQNKRNEK